MPVDFVDLPESVTIEPKRPNPAVWAVLLVVAIAIGIALTLTLWPKDRSPQCWQFYTWMIGVPSICWVVVLAARIHLYETALLQVQSHNAERTRTVDHNTAYARRPLLLLSHALITPMPERAAATAQSASEGEADGNDNGHEEKKQLSLSARVVAGEKSLESKQVRETKEVRVHSNFPRDDYPSAADILEAMFPRLITDIKPAIDRIPLGAPFEIWLDVLDAVAANAALEVWRRANWQVMGSMKEPRVLGPGDGVMSLDTWLDDDSHARFKFVLLVSAQIREDVPANSGEAAVAMLLGWPELSDSLKFEPLARVHRPVTRSSDHECSVLATALDWSAARPDEIGRTWESGLPEVQRQSAADSTRFASDNDASKVTSIDQALGHTGAASGWLAIALAAEHAVETKRAQLISTSAQQQPCWLVVRPHQVETPVSE